jgi:trinucleotide repeat-containing gene 6 protein
MAVQAGHLNPQILNQPLAPQTLILLNQLLQQIKNLQGLQQQHNMAQAQKGPQGALLQVSVNITKTKQQIVNLQNQISVQQANYLKSQQITQQHIPDQQTPGGGGGGLQDMFSGLNLNSGPSNTSEIISNGSRLAQWKMPEDSFAKAPGGASSKLPTTQTSPNLLLDDGPWSNSNTATSGWPEKSAPEQSNTINGLDNFGIPEFEPGKPWKGPGLKNPDDDPTLTPGSVAPTALQIDPLSKSAVSSSNNSISVTSAIENTLGLTSPTWSFGNTKSDMIPKTSVAAPTAADAWGAPSSSSSLTPMGQDLWGKAGRTTGSGPPGLVTTAWPSTAAAAAAAPNGIEKHWSGGQNGAAAVNTDGPTWLLLKNLTAQIDGSTLKTLCMQHGPLKHFHLYLNHSLALVNYNSGREAAKAQKALNNCLLGNTTIMATSASDSEVGSILQSLGGQQQQQQGGSNRGTTPVVSSSSIKTSSSNDMWGPINSSPASSSPSTLFGGNNQGGGSVWGAPPNSNDDQHRTTPLQAFIGDLDI